MNGNSIRISALIRKEFRQMLRDRSTLTLGIILPMTLLIIFGYGLSLDVRHVPVAVVRDTSSPLTRDFYTALSMSTYIEPVWTNSWQQAEHMLANNEINAIVRRSRDAKKENIQIIVNGRDSNTARIMLHYLEAAIGQWVNRRVTVESFHSDATGSIVRAGNQGGVAEIVPRIWYNAALESRFFLVPGVIVLIMTLIGSLLTALVVAREWERGTWEALAATPVLGREILVGKTVPYFLLGMVGLFLSLAAGTFVFEVPVRGSFLLIVLCSAIYLLASLGMGLLISAQFKSQFLASQIVLIVSFMPTVMLSGFIFDLKSAPIIAQYIAHIFPATWYVELLQTLFLVGNVPKILVCDCLVLLGFAVILLLAACSKLRTNLE